LNGALVRIPLRMGSSNLKVHKVRRPPKTRPKYCHFGHVD
jgi:hypothetical protein